jgi:hypothetical protein
MEIKGPLLKVLRKTYAQSTVIETKFGKHDITFKTNDVGQPILLFLGKKSSNGLIRGERYIRKFKTDEKTGVIIKDYWEHKGRATP